MVEPVAVEKPVAATNPDPVQKIIVQEEKIAPVQAKIATDSPSQSTDLWTRVVARIDKDSLQKSLKDLSSISSLENGVAHIMVINKFAQMALESHENRNYIEKLLSEEHGSPIQIKVEFQSKEDFFSGMLG
ncbi:TPA: hypothetical protein DIC40_01135 [Patescibacteria group bacterium]|nr:hypothetical protein [Candidatus Gracilibacteria bacterium]